MRTYRRLGRWLQIAAVGASIALFGPATAQACGVYEGEKTTIAVQGSTTNLWAAIPAEYTCEITSIQKFALGMAGGTNPGVAYHLRTTQIAFQANTSNLDVYEPGFGGRLIAVGLAAGTSPSEAGNFVAFVAGGANQGELWEYDGGLQQARGLGLGVEAGTNPSLAGYSQESPSYPIAFQANGGHSGELWVYNANRGAGEPLNLGMEKGTSPSITQFREQQGAFLVPGYMIAFVAGGEHPGELWIYDSITKVARGLGLGVETGTSPAITGLQGGGYEIAFQASGAHTGEVWKYAPSSGGIGLGLGIEKNTSPAIGPRSRSGNYLIAFQASGSHAHELWQYSPLYGGRADGIPMAAGTSPGMASY